MNMAGKLSRRGSPTEVRHVAEILAGMTDVPPIGAPQDHVIRMNPRSHGQQTAAGAR